MPIQPVTRTPTQSVIRRELRTEPVLPPWRCCNRLTTFSSADAKSIRTPARPINTLILKGIISFGKFSKNGTEEFFCVLLPMHKNFSQCLSGPFWPIWFHENPAPA